MYNGLWSWDDAKNELNLKNHGFDFWTAGLVFSDQNYIVVQDRIDPETGEERWHAIGKSCGAIITVVHAYRRIDDKEITHFITAFRSDDRQVQKYYAQDVD